MPTSSFRSGKFSCTTDLTKEEEEETEIGRRQHEDKRKRCGEKWFDITWRRKNENKADHEWFYESCNKENLVLRREILRCEIVFAIQYREFIQISNCFMVVKLDSISRQLPHIVPAVPSVNIVLLSSTFPQGQDWFSHGVTKRSRKSIEYWENQPQNYKTLTVNWMTTNCCSRCRQKMHENDVRVELTDRARRILWHHEGLRWLLPKIDSAVQLLHLVWDGKG